MGKSSAQIKTMMISYGQAERAISTGKLNVLLRLHIRAYQRGSLPRLFRGLLPGDLILWRVSRLYAFSVYPNRTSLPSYATGVTTGYTRGSSNPVLSY